MMWFTRTLRFRLTAWYCFALALGLCVFGVVLMGLAERHLLINRDESMTFKGHAVIYILSQQQGGEGLSPWQLDRLSRLGKVAITEGGQGAGGVVYRAPELLEAPVMARGMEDKGENQASDRFSTVIENGDYWRIYTLLYRDTRDREITIRVMEELGDVEGALKRLKLAFFYLAPIGILVSLLGGFILSTKALAPISNIIDLAERIEPQELSQRLPHPGVEDELGRLVSTLNRMIGRIEACFDAMKRFTSDASHELRGPLATIRNTVDVTLAMPSTAEERDAALHSIGEEVDRIRALVEDLLLLARADSGRMVMQRQPVSLDVILEAQVEAHQPQAQEREIRLVVKTLLTEKILGDERWLHQVVGNLLDNAIKYTPVGGAVEVDMVRTQGELRFSVSDTGPGIPDEDLERVFERFFRSDPSRSRTAAPGLGLGLAIVAWVVGEHQGRIQAANRPDGGASFIVMLPLGEASA